MAWLLLLDGQMMAWLIREVKVATPLFLVMHACMQYMGADMRKRPFFKSLRMRWRSCHEAALLAKHP